MSHDIIHMFTVMRFLYRPAHLADFSVSVGESLFIVP